MTLSVGNESNYSLINQIRRHNRVRLVAYIIPLEQGVTAFKGSNRSLMAIKPNGLTFSSSREKEKAQSRILDQKQQQLINESFSRDPYSSLSCAQSLMSRVSEFSHESTSDLSPIITPSAPSWWPLAWGWWL